MNHLLFKKVGAEINAMGINDEKLKPVSHRGLTLGIWGNCEARENVVNWPSSVISSEKTEWLRVWPKIVKPRGFEKLEWYIRITYEDL